MPYLPKQLTTLLGGDSALGRVTNHVRSAVQPTLDFLNTYLAPGPNNTLQVLRDAVLLGRLLVNNDVTVQGGNVIVRARADNGLVVTPFGTGPAFYTTDPKNTAALFLVMGDGMVYGSNAWSNTGPIISTNTVQGANIVSQAGIIGAEFDASYNAAINAGYTLLNEPVSTLPRNWRMPRNGSVISLYYQGTQNNASNAAAQLYKNGALFNGASSGVVSVSATQGNISATFAKGVLPFNAGDLIRPAIYTQNATNGLAPYHRAYIQVYVEWSS